MAFLKLLKSLCLFSYSQTAGTLRFTYIPFTLFHRLLALNIPDLRFLGADNSPDMDGRKQHYCRQTINCLAFKRKQHCIENEED